MVHYHNRVISEVFFISLQVQALQWPITIDWRKGRSMHWSMGFGYILSVVVTDKVVYCSDGHSVLQYILETGFWSNLPSPSSYVCNFGMAALKGQLVLAGGTNYNKIAFSSIRVWDATQNQWCNQYPAMPTAQSSPTVVGYKHYLLVAGDSREVEILDTTTGRWHSPEPPPIEKWGSSTVGSDDWYIHTGQSVVTVHIPTLVTTANNTTTSIWQHLPGPPVSGSSLLAPHGHLLAVGDTQKTEKETLNAEQATVGEETIPIYRYDPEANKWVECGEWPLTLARASCAVLPTGQLMAVLPKTSKLHTKMWLGTISNNIVL